MKSKRYMPKVIAGILCMMMVAGTVSAAAYSAGSVNVSQTASALTTAGNSSDKESGELTKNETVYVIANADGTPKKIIVSDWIKNPEKLNTINDKTNLEDVKNVKGDEKFTLNDDGMCVWDAQGNDIYYQGKGKDALPVDLSVSYILDGKSVSPDELKGKSGKLTIRYDYKNKQYETVNINGISRKIYVPFVMITGMILDNDKVNNVEVSSGKVINDGSHTIVAGFALPGMDESLNLKTDEIELPDYVEITADVTDFEIGTTITLATNDMFSDIDFSKADKKIEELEDKINKLTDGVEQLLDGSSKLYNGLATLADKSGDLIAGVKKLADGSKQLSDGASSLADGSKELDKGMKNLFNGISKLDKGTGKLEKGAKKLYKGVKSLNSGVKTLDKGAAGLDDGAESLQGGISQLYEGLSQLSGNSGSLQSGAKKVFESLLSTADKQLAAAGVTADKLTIDNYATVLDGIEKSLDKDAVYKLAYDTAYETVSNTVNAQKDLIKGQVEAAVRLKVLEGVLKQSGLGLTAEQYSAAVEGGQIDEATQAAINGAVDQQMASDEMKQTVDAQTEAQIKNLIDTNMESDDVVNQINAAVEKASTGAESIKSLKTQLDSFNTFYQGVISYTNGVDSASQGASQLVSGSTQLKDGTDQLHTGTSKLKKGAKKLKNGTSDLINEGIVPLKSGTSQLKSGAEKLKDGTSKLSKGAVTLSDGAKKLYTGVDVMKNGAKALVAGVGKLKDGSLKLRNGIQKLNDEGITAINDLVKGDAKELVERIKAISKVSSHYNSYGGITDNMAGKVDFIYKTDEK